MISRSKTQWRRLLWSGSAAALIGCSTHLTAATIGLNFSDDWGSGGGAEVTEAAFGVPLARWFNLPRIPNSESGSGVSSNSVVPLPEGGSLQVEWSCINTYSLLADPPTGPGEDQVIYGYLDDTGTGYRVRVSGFRDSVSSYTVTLIASTDGGEGFTDAFVAYGSDTNAVSYTEILTPSFAGGAYSTSSASSSIPTQTTNNSVVITGSPREGSLRSTLAGILIDYTPGGQNPPVVEVNPEPPAGTVFAGSTITLGALVSGTPNLSYQWRLDGEPIANANGPTYTKMDATTADSGAYDLVATNSFGSVTSRVANVTVAAIIPPQITTAPASQTLYPGYPASFAVQATGGQLSYQWNRGSEPMNAATNDTLNLASITVADQGSYSVTVTNPAGTATAELTVLTPTSPFAAAVVTTKPLLYLRMSETGPVFQAPATNLGSLGVAGFGAYVGSLSHQTEGALVGSSDTAVTLSGGRVGIGYSPALNPPGSFTVECWARPLDVGSGNRVLVQSMINGEMADNANDRSGWAFRQSGANLQFLIGGADGNPFYTATVTATDGVTAGVWSHYAAVYDSASLSVSLLVNGVVATKVTVDSPVLPNVAAPVLLGDRGYGGWTFKGTLDEVALYSAALSVEQLKAHYDAGTNAATSGNYPALIIADGAVEYLRLDDPALPPFTNAAANAGTLGSAWTGSYVGAGSTPGNALVTKGSDGPRPEVFPGLETTNTAVAMTNGWVTSPPLPLSDRVTAVAWINRQEISTTGDLSWPAWLGGGGLHLNNGNVANPEAELRYHWNGEKWDWGSGLFVPPNVWTFVALVVDPEQATLYMSEGKTLTSAVNTTAHAPMVVNSATGFGGNQPDRADRNYIGQIDEVAVYNRALTPEEITAVFEGAFASGPLPPSPLILTASDGVYQLTWTSGVLQSATSLSGTYSDVADATSPYPMVVTDSQKFFRLRSN